MRLRCAHLCGLRPVGCGLVKSGLLAKGMALPWHSTVCPVLQLSPFDTHPLFLALASPQAAAVRGHPV